RFSASLVRLLEGAAAEPERRISELPLLSPAEVRQLAAAGDGGEVPADAGEGLALDGLVLRWAERMPRALALSGGGEELTYADLAARAGRLAHRLRALGVAEEGIVAVCLERSVPLVIAELGVRLAGGAYLPIDPAQPEERRALMVAGSGARAVVATSALAGSWCGGAAVVRLDAEPSPAEIVKPIPPPARSFHPDQLAYLIYTSGSTGVPKGVAISHRAAVHFVSWQMRLPGWTAEDRGSLLAGPGFDATVL